MDEDHAKYLGWVASIKAGDRVGVIGMARAYSDIVHRVTKQHVIFRIRPGEPTQYDHKFRRDSGYIAGGKYEYTRIVPLDDPKYLSIIEQQRLESAADELRAGVGRCKDIRRMVAARGLLAGTMDDFVKGTTEVLSADAPALVSSIDTATLGTVLDAFLKHLRRRDK